MAKKFQSGDVVWVLSRSAYRKVENVGIRCFVTTVGEFAIVTPPHPYFDFEGVMMLCAESTRRTKDTDLQVFPLEDCFDNREEAEKAAGIE